MRGIGFGLLVAALIAPGAEAQRRDGTSRDVRASYNTCMDASGGVTSAMLDCIGVEYDYQDGLLNAAYRKTMARLTPAQQIVLRNSQRKWLREREGECLKDLEELEGGTLATVMRNTCMLYSVIARTDWLTGYRPRR